MWKGAMAHDFRQQLAMFQTFEIPIFVLWLTKCSLWNVHYQVSNWEICFNKYGKSKAMKYKVNNKEIRLKSKQES